jgi:phosphoribosyl-dephospho-CoA transferase
MIAGVARGALPRHTLVWPAAAARDRLAAQLADDAARAALGEWFDRVHPLVVRRVEGPTASSAGNRGIAVGLPLPPDRGKRRLAMTLAHCDVACHSAPLTLAHITHALPAPWRNALATLDRDARALGVTLRGFGSAAWQAITGLAYLRDDSDVDLLFTPQSRSQLDAMLDRFERFERATKRRIDAEIRFAGDAAVAWREWRDAREGSRVIVKALRGAELVARADLLRRLPPGVS